MRDSTFRVPDIALRKVELMILLSLLAATGSAAAAWATGSAAMVLGNSGILQ
ncbi:hypothetical protein [Nocardia brasiliensis]|uniref:hypothetical protein n=1 Tax=Nocardia brasiliensis TaxID=37326 RepID=UPI0033F78C50